MLIQMSYHYDFMTFTVALIFHWDGNNGVLFEQKERKEGSVNSLQQWEQKQVWKGRETLRELWLWHENCHQGGFFLTPPASERRVCVVLQRRRWGRPAGGDRETTAVASLKRQRVCFEGQNLHKPPTWELKVMKSLFTDFPSDFLSFESQVFKLKGCFSVVLVDYLSLSVKVGWVILERCI